MASSATVPRIDSLVTMGRASPVQEPADQKVPLMTASVDRLFQTLIRVNDLALAPGAPNRDTLVAAARELLWACDADRCAIVPEPEAGFAAVDIGRDGTAADAACPPPAGSMARAPLAEHGLPMGELRVWRSGLEPFSLEECALVTSAGGRLGASLRRRHLQQQLRNATEAIDAGVDVRNRQLAELNAEMVRQKEVAEAASVAKSEFLANMSHEIRTPMNGIMGMAEILADTNLAVDQRSYLASLITCARSLLDVLNDILDISRIEAGRVELERIPFDPRDAVESVGAMLATRAAERGVELVCRVASGMPAQVYGDPGRLRQILTNLTANALKFTRRGEVVIVARSEPDRGRIVRLVFEVRDTGIGIPEERIPQLFEKFTQVDGSTRRRHGGAGLGLAICRDLLQLMGGTIDVDSRLGFGSTFRFGFPVEVARAEFDANRGNVFNGCKILLVDDQASSRAAVAGMLIDAGCLVESASNSKAAIEALTNEAYDVAILDAALGSLDGYDTIAAMRSIPEGKDVRLILMASVARRRDQVRAKSLGISGFLQKPVRRDALVGALQRALSQGPPSLEDAPPSVRIEDSPKSAPRNARILLVEDNDINRRVIALILERAGYHVIVAATGEEALAVAAAEKLDAVLMDVQMPGMDGFDATLALRGIPAMAAVPIIAVTAHAMLGDEKRCRAAGMNAYVSKPIDRVILLETLAVQLRGESPDRSAARLPAPEPAGESGAPVEQVAINLDRLANDTGWDFAVAHVARYLQRASAWVDEAFDATEQTDAERVARITHQVRGGAIQMPLIEQAATAAMQSAHDRNLLALRPALDHLRQAVAVTRASFERKLADANQAASSERLHVP